MKLLLILIFVCNASIVKSSLDCSQADISEKITGDSFSGLNFNSTKIISTICLDPVKNLLFDTTFNLKGANLAENISLQISNLRGFAMTNSFSLNGFKNGELSLKNSSFDFFHINGTKFDNDLCKSVDEKEIFISALNAFSRLDLNDNIRFSENTCPIHFKNVYLNQLSISKLNSSNMLGFLKLNHNSNSINSSIDNLKISESQFSLDDNLFDQEIFERTKKLSIDNSCLENIKEDLFQNSSLNEIELKLNCFGDFIKNRTGWLKHLNSNNKVDSLELKLTDLKSIYEYPDDDFCLFKNLPKKKGIIPVIQTKPSLKCSCTLLWFLEEKNENVSEKLSTNSTKDCLDDSDFDTKLKNCKFDEKLKECEPTTTVTTLETTAVTIIANNTTTNETITTTTIITSTESDKKDSNKIFEILMIVFIVLTIILIIILVVFFLKYKKSRSKEDRQINLNDSRSSTTQNGTRLYKL